MGGNKREKLPGAERLKIILLTAKVRERYCGFGMKQEQIKLVAEMGLPKYVHSEVVAATDCGNRGLQNFTSRLPRDKFDFIETAEGHGPRLYSLLDAIFIATLHQLRGVGVVGPKATAYADFVRQKAVENVNHFPSNFVTMGETYISFCTNFGPYEDEADLSVVPLGNMYRDKPISEIGKQSDQDVNLIICPAALILKTAVKLASLREGRASRKRKP